MRFNSSGSGRGETTASDESKSGLLSAISVKFKRGRGKNGRRKQGGKREATNKRRTHKIERGGGSLDPGKVKQVANKRRDSNMKARKKLEGQKRAH